MKPLAYYLLMNINHILKVRFVLLLSIAYTVFILVFSLINLKDVDVIKLESSDKVYHTTIYALMVLLWSFYFSLKHKLKNKLQKLWLVFAIIMFGIIIEVLQLLLTDYRSFDWWDVIANITGVIIGLFAFSLIEKYIINENI